MFHEKFEKIFITTIDGKLVYFPYGIFGKGFAIPTMEKRRKIQDKINRFLIYYLMSLSIFCISTLFAIWHYSSVDGLLRMDIALIGIIVFGIFSFLSYFQINKPLLTGLEESTEKYPFMKVTKRTAHSLNFSKFLLIEFSLLFLMAVFISEGFIRPVLSQSNPQPSLLLQICMVVSLLICILVFAWFILLFSIHPNYWGLNLFLEKYNIHKATEDGKIIYFPKGFANKGYILPDQETFNTISQVRKRRSMIALLLYVVAIIISFLSLLFVSPESKINPIVIVNGISLLIILVIFLMSSRKIQKFLIGLEEIPAEMTRLKLIKKNIPSMSWYYFIFLFFGLIWFLHLGYILAFEPSFSPEIYRPMGIIGLTLGIPFFIFVCYLFFLKFRSCFHV